MTGTERALLAIISSLLEYPDAGFFKKIPAAREEISTSLADNDDTRKKLLDFLDKLELDGLQSSQEKYVALFDHDPGASLYMAWHRYGNDRSQGKAMAALNGLYRAAGFEPVAGAMPDYLPRILEFLSICEDWSAEVVLNGFGPELVALEKHLAEQNSAHASLISAALEPLRSHWPALLKPRTGSDPTARPMATARKDLEPLRSQQPDV